MRGLGGGVTWAWDPQLCDELLPLFRETAVVYNNLVDCRGIKAAVTRAFFQWESNSNFLKMVDMSAECEKLGLAYGPPQDEAHAGLFQDPQADFHGGCPLAEIWVTSMATQQPDRSRRLEEGNASAASYAFASQSNLESSGTDQVVASAPIETGP